MIQLNELRLGNYVLGESSYGDLLIQINGITSTSIHGIASISDLSVSGMTADEVKPIPLTEEILFKCGFKIANEYKLQAAYEPNIFELDDIYIKFGSEYTDKPEEYYLYSIGRDDWSNEYIGNPIKSLHQLQNIIMDLTGKELEVKL